MPPKSIVTCRNCKRDLPRDAFDIQPTKRDGNNAGIKKSCRECCANWVQIKHDRAVAGSEERFWSMVDRSGGPDACWPWQGSIVPSGYGQFKARHENGAKNWRAHRYAYTITYGDIPDGMIACHRCDNPPCCNPAHLFVGTNADNTADGRLKGRIVRKLGPIEIAAIRSAYAAGGTSYAKLGKQYGVTFGTIRDVVKGTIGAASDAEHDLLLAFGTTG